MSCARYRMSKALLALVLACGVFACIGGFGASQAYAANSITVTKAGTPSFADSYTSKTLPKGDGGHKYTYTKMAKVATDDVHSYHVGDLWCSTKSSVSISSLFGGFASANDKVVIKGTYIEPGTKKAADSVEKGALDKVATQSVEDANDGELITTTYGELKSKNARIALYYAASAETDKDKAQKANLAVLKAKNSVNGSYAPALFETKSVDGIEETRILKITSITFVDSAYSGKYASVSIDPVTFTGKKAAPKAKLTYCGKQLDASVSTSAVNVTSSAKATVTAKLNDHKISKDGTFSIKPATLKSASLGYASTTYNGTYKKPSVSKVQANGVSGNLASSNYAVSYQNNFNAGTAKVVVTGKGNYTGSVTKTFKIKKAKQSFSVDTSIKNESWRSTQAGNHGTSKYNVKGAKGKITFTKVSGSSRLKVNGATSQRLMVKRGTAKGTYSIKVRVTAGETANYAATSKTVTLKVRLR